MIVRVLVKVDNNMCAWMNDWMLFYVAELHEPNICVAIVVNEEKYNVGLSLGRADDLCAATEADPDENTRHCV